MALKKFCLVLLFILNFHLILSSSVNYVTKYADISLDHFSFTNNITFKLRYLINDTYWRQDHPIFFYTGNEGDVTLFAENTGFMWEIAPEFHALLVFAEHRYYGTSLPFGNKSLSDPKYSGYLTTSQTLADYVDLIELIRKQYKTSDSVKVIAFGGSYGGMLASWMRMKYPAYITGAIAASAPIWQFTGMTPCHTFNRIASSVFAQESPGCDKFIKNTWKYLDSLGSSDTGRAWLNTEFKPCKPFKTNDDINKLKEWLTGIYGNLAMINYPYPANFLAQLPANPVKAVCSNFPNGKLSDKESLTNLFKGISIYFNSTGTEKCLSLQDSDKLGTDVWDYQTCSEIVMPMCDDGESDMFEKSEWNISEVSDSCFKRFQVRPQVDLIKELYGGKDIEWSSNIIFSNGLLDPWSGGGVTYNVSKTSIAILIPGVAHHLDLRFSNQADPTEIVEVRNYYRHIIRRWIHSTHYEVKMVVNAENL